MLIHFALAYAVSWLFAAVVAAVVEALRLHTTGKLPPVLDWTGALCLAWVAAPVAGPVLAGVRLWGWVRG